MPDGYVSGSLLSTTTTYANHTFASLAVTPGVYTWSWGSGRSADFLQLVIGVPEPGTVGLLAAGLLLIGWRRKRPGRPNVAR